MIFLSVDFPDPLDPTSATNSPRPISIETPRTACTSTSPVLYVFRTSSSRTATELTESFIGVPGSGAFQTALLLRTDGGLRYPYRSARRGRFGRRPSLVR